MSEMLTLTDDEAVAIALATNGVWPSPLPTVDVSDVDAVAAAGMRGVRSLNVRELMGDDGTFSAELQPAMWIAGCRSMVAVYPATEAFERAAWRLSSTHYRSGGDWLVESVDAIGIHHIGVSTSVDRREAMKSIMAAITSGDAPPSAPSPSTSPWQLVVAELTDGEPGVVIVARPGGVTRAILAVEAEGLVETDHPQPISADEALDLIDSMAHSSRM